MKLTTALFTLGCVALASGYGDEEAATPPQETSAPQADLAHQAPPMQTVWDNVAYPDFCDLYASGGVGFGLSHYHINAVPLQTEHLQNVSIAAFTLGLTQVLGYSHWFYLQFREDFSYGNTFYGGKTSTGTFPDRCRSSWFFDADARLFFPFRVSCEHRLSLQPFVGFAIHQAYLKGGISTDSAADPRRQMHNTLLRQRFLVSVIGLAFGYNPNDAFAMRSSLSLHIPSAKQALPVEESQEASNYKYLRAARHGIGGNFLAMARLTPNWMLTGEVDYCYYSMFNSRHVETLNLWETNATSRLSIKCGATYQY